MKKLLFPFISIILLFTFYLNSFPVPIAPFPTVVAVGQYDTQQGKAPMLVVTKSLGHTWEYKIHDSLLLPPHASRKLYVTFKDVSCSEKTCVAVGFYDSEYFESEINQYFSKGYFPMLVVSHDSGNTWEYKIFDTNLPPPHAAKVSTSTVFPENRVTFNSVSCSKNVCAAVGQYYNDRYDTVPMLVVSTDHGNTWQYKMYDTLLNPPDAFKSPSPHVHFTGSLSRVSCSENICVSVGSYEVHAETVQVSPMLIVSVDGGNTWNYKIHAKELLPPDTITHTKIFNLKVPVLSGRFDDVSCSGKTCTAAGYYVYGGRDEGCVGEKHAFCEPAFLMAAVSMDGGHHWEYKVHDDKNSERERNYRDIYTSTSVSCSGSVCNVIDGTDIAVSVDAGKTWNYKSILSLLPQAHAHEFTGLYPCLSGIHTSLTSMSCSGNTCNVIGSYETDNTYQRQKAEFGLFSLDGGTTWEYKIGAPPLQPPLTESRTETTLNSIRCNATFCGMVGYYRMKLETIKNNRLIYSSITVPTIAMSYDNGHQWDYVVYNTHFLPPNIELESHDANFTAISITD